MPKTTLLRKQVTQTGTIQPHAGPTAPEGYLLCDGTIVNIADYPKLYAIIGTSWGHGNEVSPGVSDGLTFHLPDLRGRFLRGVDNPTGIPGEEAGLDPDAASREPSNDGGNSGDAVGAIQNDKTRMPRDSAFVNANSGQHRHTFNNNTTALGESGSGKITSGSNAGSQSINGTIMNTAGTHSHVISGGDAETRPVNAGVVYIIKAV